MILELQQDINSANSQEEKEQVCHIWRLSEEDFDLARAGNIQAYMAF